MDSTQVRQLTVGYPWRHRTSAIAHPDADMTYMESSAGAEFRGHCWDESGH
jgi:hypothetical protein